MKYGIVAFLSEESINLHKDYLRNLKLRHSVNEKCDERIKEKSVLEISKIKRLEGKEDIIRLKLEIQCHELYFSSFGKAYKTSESVKKYYGTESSFLYLIYGECMRREAKFLMISSSGGRPQLDFINDFKEAIGIPSPHLAIDLCEHSYFLDYHFDKSTYLKTMLPYLSLERLDKK